MTISLGSAYATLGLDASGFINGAKQASQAVDNFHQNTASKMKSVGESMMNTGKKWTLFATAPIMGGLTLMYKEAGSLQQALGKTDAVFGDMSASIIAWSKTSAESFGMSQRSALDMTSTYAQIMTAQGMTMEQSAQYSKQLIQLGADMSAFSDRDVSDTSAALRAAMTGEYETLKSYGIVLKATTVEEEALNIARAEGTENVTEAHRMQARYNLVMKQTTNMQGQFAREADGAAGSAAIFRAKLQDLTGQLGTALLPIGTKVTQWLSNMLTAFMKLPSWMQTGVVVIAALVAAIGPLLIGIGAMVTGLAALPAIIGAVATAMSALLLNPAFLIAAVAIGALFLAWKTNFLGFGDLVDGAVGKLKDFASLFMGIPGTKNIGLTLDTSLTGDEDAWTNWTQMEDGTWKHATLDITTAPLDSTVEEILDPATGQKSWVLHVDVDGDGAQDATRIIDSVDQGGGKFVMTVEVNGARYEAWYDQTTGQTLLLPMEVELTNTGEANTWWEEWQNKTATVEIILKVIGLSILDGLRNNLQKIADVAMLMLNPFNLLGDIIVGWTWGKLSDSAAFDWIDNKLDAIGAKFSWLATAWNSLPFVGDDGGSDNPNDPNGDGIEDPLEDAPQANRGGGKMASGMGYNPNSVSDVGYSPIQFDSKGASSFREQLDALVAANKAAWQTVTTDTGQFSTQTRTLTDTNFRGATESAKQSMTSLAGNVAANASAASASASAQFTSMKTASVAQFGAMQGGALGKLTAMAGDATSQGTATMANLVGALTGGVARVALSLMGVVTAVRNTGASAQSAAYSAGANISLGFAQGMNAYLGAVIATANAMVNAASAAVRARAMIQSPSKLFMKYGAYVGEGFEIGIRNSIPSVALAAQALLGSGVPSPALSSPLGGGYASSATVIDNSTTTQQYIALTESDYQRLLNTAETAPERTIDILNQAQSAVNRQSA